MSKCYINEEVWLLCSESPDTPVKLKNTHALTVNMHGFLPATENDNAFGFNIGPFGKCNRRGEDCFSYIQRQLTEWYDLPETNVTISGARPLDENSKCFCKSGLGTINIFLSKEAALNSGIQPAFVLPSELDSFLTTGVLVFGLGRGIPALATASKTAFKAGKVVVDFTAGLGSVIWTMDKVQDKIAGAMLYLGADPSLTGDVMDFLDNLAGVFQNYTDGNAYLSLVLSAGDLAAYGDVKPNGRLYSDADGGGTLKNGIKPTGEKGGVPVGKIKKSNDRPTIREVETAQIFAKEGYKVEILPEVDGGNGYGIKPNSNPDYLIEGKVFDCYSPEYSSTLETQQSVIKKKIKNQAPNIVVNVEDMSQIQRQELRELIIRKANPTEDLKRLEELFFIEDGKIIKIF